MLYFTHNQCYVDCTCSCLAGLDDEFGSSIHQRIHTDQAVFSGCNTSICQEAFTTHFALAASFLAMVTAAVISSATQFLRFATGPSQFAAAFANGSARAFSASASAWSDSPLKAALSSKIPAEQVAESTRSLLGAGTDHQCRHPVLSLRRILCVLPAARSV